MDYSTITLLDFCDKTFLESQDAYEMIGLYKIIRSTDMLKFKDCELTVKELGKFYYSRWLPSKNLVCKKNGAKPVIEYTFHSSSCQFGAYCTICDTLITKAYVRVDCAPFLDERGIIKDKGLEKAYAEKYKTLGFWTRDGWLLCQKCKLCNDYLKIYDVERHFEFHGDLPRGRSKYRHEYGNFNCTTPTLFRDE